MNIQFTGKNVDITQALRDFTINKFKRLERYVDTITSIHVTFKVEKLRQQAAATIHIPDNEINAQAESESIYKSIDLLLDRLVRQLTKHKEKETDHRS